MAEHRADHPLRAVALVGAFVAAVLIAFTLNDSDRSESSRAAVAVRSGITTTSPPQTRVPVGAETLSSTSSTTPTGPAADTTSREPTGEAVTIAFAGDTHFSGGLRATLLANPSGALAPVAPIFQAADLAMVNFETAITERGAPAVKAFTFRSPAASFTALKAAGIDVISTANNHGMDYGTVGLEDTIAAGKAAGFPVIGIGADENAAYAPFTTTIKGQRISILAATDVLDANLVNAWTATTTKAGLASAKRLDRLTAAVRQARAASDTVVVFLHWGTETIACATTAQKTLAKALVGAGADIVVGSHAHVLEGAGRLGGAYVAYGLGNFAFYHATGLGARSGILTLTVRGRHVDTAVWTPATIPGGGGVPRPLTGLAATQAVAAFLQLRSCTDLEPA